ncbi:MAG: NAD(P)H-binding protein [Acidobacteriota bacterium]
MRTVVFGASGGCGGWVVKNALERGHEVTAAVRPASAGGLPEGAAVATGSALDPDFVAGLVAEHQIVISCLGLRRASLLPWSKLLSPPDLVQTFTDHLVAAVAESKVRRVLWISAGGVAESYGQAAPVIRTMIQAGHVATAYADLAAAESRVPGDDPRWLTVRPVTLAGGSTTGRAGPVERYGLLSRVRRSDVAAWMLDVAEGRVVHKKRTVLLGTP